MIAADTDAEHLDKLTKRDMTDFYSHYISTSSSKRSKLSVHLQAQSKPKEPTLDEKKASAIAALQIILTQHKIEPKVEDVQSRVKDVPSAEAIPEAISTYLSSLSLDPTVADKVDVKSVSDASHPVIIKDIHAFKASMQVSAGVRPVRNLDEFVEIGEKL
jgi:insulysin